MFSYAVWSAVANIGFTFRDQGLNVILNLFFGTTMNAARGIAMQVGTLVNSFSKNFILAVNPQITKQYAAGNYMESRNLGYLGARIAFYLLSLMTIPLLINVDYVLKLWLSDVPEYTSLFLCLVLLSALLYAMSQSVTIAIQATGVEKVYNSAAILYPNGKIDSYQKIHRAGQENKWSVTGKTPKIIETKWGKIGVDICRDGHFYPELGRYYAAMGCTMFVHPTATTGNAWYRSTRIGSYVDRDGMAAITCNLLGGDGIYVADGAYTYSPDDIDENGDFVGGSAIPETIYNQNEIEDDPYWNSRNWLGTGGVFNSTSFIATKGSTA